MDPAIWNTTRGENHGEWFGFSCFSDFIDNGNCHCGICRKSLFHFEK